MQKKLIATADNCSGQNKNRFMVWYFLMRVVLSYEDSIELCFLIAGHTKNNVDGAFGYIKRELKKTNVHGPREKMEEVKRSSDTNEPIRPVDVKWINYKGLLEKYFTVPKSFKITQYHIFKFISSDPSAVRVKKFKFIF